ELPVFPGGEMQVGEAEEQNQKSQHQKITGNGNPSFFAVNLPAPAAQAVADDVHDVGELVGKKQNADASRRQREPGDLGMMRVEKYAVILQPSPDEIGDASRRRHQPGQQKDVAGPVNAQGGRGKLDPSLDQRVGFAHQAFGVRGVGSGVDAADRRSGDDV